MVCPYICHQSFLVACIQEAMQFEGKSIKVSLEEIFRITYVCFANLQPKMLYCVDMVKSTFKHTYMNKEFVWMASDKKKQYGVLPELSFP